MLQDLTASVRRWAGLPVASTLDRSPLVRLDSTTEDAVHSAQTDIGMLRGISTATADTAECACPESCERDHANE
jgi:hypothetical protein